MKPLQPANAYKKVKTNKLSSNLSSFSYDDEVNNDKNENEFFDVFDKEKEEEKV